MDPKAPDFIYRSSNPSGRNSYQQHAERRKRLRDTPEWVARALVDSLGEQPKGHASTRHGHPCCDQAEPDVVVNVVNCGGPSTCEMCKREALRTHWDVVQGPVLLGSGPHEPSEANVAIRKILNKGAVVAAEHMCTGELYFCPTSGDFESTCHGGFDVCCDRPDQHRPPTTEETS